MTCRAPAAVLLTGVLVITLTACCRTTDSEHMAEQRTRTAGRAETVTAAEAWRELASLGAVEHLAELLDTTVVLAVHEVPACLAQLGQVSELWLDQRQA